MANNEQTTVTQKYRVRYHQLYDEASSWRALWSDIVDYVVPRKGRYLSAQNESPNDGRPKRQKVVKNATGLALRTLTAGMYSGLTSPSRPWYVFGLTDKELMEYAPVRDWLTTSRDLVLGVFARSNFYQSAKNLYKELGAFGINSMIIEEDFKSVVRFRPMTIGEFYISLDYLYQPQALYRKFSVKAHQIVEEFGIENVSGQVKAAYMANNYKGNFDVIHCITPNEDQDNSKKDFKGMAYLDIYFEASGDPDTFLRLNGFRERPFVAPRWDVTATDTYGDSPTIEALPDTKMLQRMQSDKLEIIGKHTRPPMNAPVDFKGKQGTIIAGGVNYYDVSHGAAPFAPVFQTNANINPISAETMEVIKDIKEMMYYDLFRAIIDIDKAGTTATEISRRYEEKLALLGPVVEGLQTEFLDPLIDRTFNIMLDFGLLPPPPEELQGMNIKVEYISILAQAQRMVGITAIEQTAAFVGNLAGLIPDVVDKFDADQAVDEYSNSIGIPPRIIRSDDKVQEIRESRAQEAQQAQQMEMAMQSIEGAKLLSETNAGGNNALEAMLGQT